MAEAAGRAPGPVVAHDAAGPFDEAYDGQGRPRAPYRAVLDELRGRDLADLASRTRDLLAERGVAFGGKDAHPFVVDPVPRILTEAEWAEISRGAAQRVRALDAFLDDVYGDQHVMRDGVVPEQVVTGSAHFETELRGVRPVGGARISLAGLDLVRGSDGRFRVLEDNVRTPSGIAYAMAAADVVREVLGLDWVSDPAREQVRAALRGVLEASAPHLDGELVLLTDGEENSAWYEHARLAEVAELVLVTPGELRRRGDRLELTDGRRVRAVYHRTGEDALRSQDGSATTLADLLAPLRAGEVGLVNWPGNGVADDKEVYAYVDALIGYYLGEDPVVPSVRTYDLSDRAGLEEVIDRVDTLVVKPRAGQGGENVVVGPHATRTTLDRTRAALRAHPEDWIAQDVVHLSTHPTVVDGRLEPRHVDLRPFVLYDGQRPTVLRGALSRVALDDGAMVVNSSRDGGGKATFVR